MQTASLMIGDRVAFTTQFMRKVRGDREMIARRGTIKAVDIEIDHVTYPSYVRVLWDGDPHACLVHRYYVVRSSDAPTTEVTP